jgi:hypothetical protein
MRPPAFFAVFLLVSLCSCAAGSHEPDAPVILSMNYMHASSALAMDDFGRARQFLLSLSGESTGDLKAGAQTAADASDIEAMRAAFKTLTEEVAVHMSYPDDYAVAFCSMYKDGSKWIQKRESPIANPYLGRSEPPCGSFVD